MTIQKASQHGFFVAALQIFPEFWAFVKTPKLIAPPQALTLLALAQLALLLVFDILLAESTLLWTPHYADYFGIPDPESYDDYTFLQLLLLVCVAAPLIEETLFRSWLNGRKTTLAVFTSLLGWGASIAILIAIEPSQPYRVLIFLAFSAAWLFLAIHLAHKNWRKSEVASFFHNHFVYLYWFSVIGFAASHAANYEYDGFMPLLPLLLSQFIGGITLGYARLRFGLLSAIALHAAFNGYCIVTVQLWA